MTNKPDAHKAPRAPRAPAAKTQTAGAKLLLTAGALAATLGGWAVLTAAEPPATVAPTQAAHPVASQALAQPSVEPVALDLPPLPTLVPLATPHAITLTELARTAVVAPVVQPVVVQPVAYVPPVAQPTVAPAAPAPRLVLRSVTAPPPNTDRGGGGGGGGGPAPATTSKSSRP